MSANTQNINAKDVAKYVLLPGILPRVHELATSGFGYLAFLFACTYKAVRILPPNHPFVNPNNIGKFGLIQVIAAAANHVELNRKNLDQIVVFLALVAALILILLQFLLVLAAVFSGQAYAAADFKSIFVTPNPGTDIAFLMLDYVFGIPGSGGGSNTFFGSNAFASSGGPTPFQQGMHTLFNFYNLALLLVAVLIFVYYVVVVVIETAQTGVPFGRRFSKLYAPFRLIAAVGLLVPLNYGFNAAQYITLYAAKMGSSMATNGWILYNENLQNPSGTENKSLVAKPNMTSINEVIYFSAIYHACREMYKIGIPKDNQSPAKKIDIKAYVVIDGETKEFNGLDYLPVKKSVGKGDLEVILGEQDATANANYAGAVRPYCGKITIPMGSDNPPSWNGSTGTSGGAAESDQGIRALERSNFYVVQYLLAANESDDPFALFGERAAHFFTTQSDKRDPCHGSGGLGDAGTCQTKWEPPRTAMQSFLETWGNYRQSEIDGAYTQLVDGLNLKMTDELAKRGWGGAGIFYNNIADLNGSFTSAVYAVPSVKQFPEIMEAVKKARQTQDTSSTACQIFNPNLSEGKSVQLNTTEADAMAKAGNAVYYYFACDKQNQDAENARTLFRGATSNKFLDVVGTVFGLNGLLDIRENTKMNKATGMPAVHPLAQLSTIGKGLVENSIRSMGMAIGAAFGGGMVSILNGALGVSLKALSSMFVGIATMGLTVGFILFYVLPFLPFIYFFFAVGSWVKSIFEAMVGVPLWALAHLSIDGDGFSGRAARGGYFLIFEIFIRPIVTVFGLIGGIAIFGAMVAMLNNLFDLVVLNTTGTDLNTTQSIVVTDVETLRRGVIDQFFYTVMYAILVYMMATSCFKMIDLVPKGIMRWIGSGVSTFNDSTGDPAGQLTQYAAIGGAGISNQIFSGVSSLAEGVGGLTGAAAKAMSQGGEKPRQGQ